MAKLGLHADLSDLATIRDFVAAAARELDLDDRTLYDLQLATDEACTNVIQHAYGGQGGKIEVTVEPVTEGVRIIVRDWGAPFDPEAVPPPVLTAPLELRPLGGLGLFLIRQTMDRVDFEFDAEHGNTLTMVKRETRGKE
jgi:anti-sigma regulatory factor (Ser/Thr protein kinase)